MKLLLDIDNFIDINKLLDSNNKDEYFDDIIIETFRYPYFEEVNEVNTKKLAEFVKKKIEKINLKKKGLISRIKERGAKKIEKLKASGDKVKLKKVKMDIDKQVDNIEQQAETAKQITKRREEQIKSTIKNKIKK